MKLCSSRFIFCSLVSTSPTLDENVVYTEYSVGNRYEAAAGPTTVDMPREGCYPDPFSALAFVIVAFVPIFISGGRKRPQKVRTQGLDPNRGMHVEGKDHVQHPNRAVQANARGDLEKPLYIGFIIH